MIKANFNAKNIHDVFLKTVLCCFVGILIPQFSFADESNTSNGFDSPELKEFISPEEMISRMIESGKIEEWAIIASIDIDQDGDIDKLMTSDYSTSRGTVLWSVHFVENGKYYYLPFSGTFSSRLDMLSFGPLDETDGHPAFVTYTKDSVSSGVTHATWFEKISESEVVRHQKTLREVDVSHGSETAEADKKFNEELFSKLGPIEFAEYKRYSREEAIEAFGIELEEEQTEEADSDQEEKDKAIEDSEPEKDDEPVEQEPSASEESNEPEPDPDPENSSEMPSDHSMIAALGALVLVLIGGGFIVARARKSRGGDSGL